jgi:hypothetical protein
VPSPLAVSLILLGLALAATGCGEAGDDCAALGDEVARENCLFERVSTLFEADDPSWRQQLEAIPSAASRDLLRLRLAILDPTRGPALCAGVETPSARARCQQVVGRPHLASPPRHEREGQP